MHTAIGLPASMLRSLAPVAVLAGALLAPLAARAQDCGRFTSVPAWEATFTLSGSGTGEGKRSFGAIEVETRETFTQTVTGKVVMSAVALCSAMATSFSSLSVTVDHVTEQTTRLNGDVRTKSTNTISASGASAFPPGINPPFVAQFGIDVIRGTYEFAPVNQVAANSKIVSDDVNSGHYEFESVEGYAWGVRNLPDGSVWVGLPVTGVPLPAAGDELSGSLGYSVQQKYSVTDAPEPGTFAASWQVSWTIVPAPPPDLPDACLASGSVIEIENQTLRESVGLDGTRLRLAYDSARMPGRGAPQAPAPAVAGWSLDAHHAYDRQGNAVLLGGGGRMGPDRLGTVPPRPDGTFLIAAEDGRAAYVFDAGGRHLRTLGALSGAALDTFAYDAAGRLESHTDRDGNVTRIERDAQGTPVAIVAPFGQRSTLEVGADGLLASVANGAGETTRLTYAGGGLLASKATPLGHATAYAWDGTGRLVEERDPAGAMMGLERVAQPFGIAVARRDRGGRVTTYSATGGGGAGASRTTALPGIQSPAQAVPLPNGAMVTSPSGARAMLAFAPDPRWGGQVRTLQSRVLSLPGGASAAVGARREVTLASASDPLSLTRQVDTLDIGGQQSTLTWEAASRTSTSRSAAGRTRAVVLDAAGRPVEARAGGLAPTSYAWDDRGRLASVRRGEGSGTRVSTLAYDGAGRLQSVTDPLGRTLAFAYDAAGRPTSRVGPGGREIRFGWDADGNLTGVTGPSQQTDAYPRDATGRVSEITLAGGGPESRTVLAYDPDGQLSTVSRPGGATLSVARDAAGRISSVTGPEGARSYAYDAASGLLERIVEPDGQTLAFTRDGGLPVAETWSGPVAGSVSRTHDGALRASGVRVGDGPVVQVERDPDGLLARSGDLALVRHPDSGLVVSSTLGGVVETTEWNGFGELVGRTASHGGTALFSQAVERDAIGRVVRVVETVGGARATREYAYDAAGALAEVRLDGAVSETHSWDANGNRLSASGPAGAVQASYDAADRLLAAGGATFAHAPTGEITSRDQGGQVTRLAHDSFGNLRRVTLPDGREVAYVVDGLNRRVGRSVGGAPVQGFLYDGQLRPVAELDGAGAVVSRFVYATRANVPDYVVKGDTAFRIVHDLVGSPRLVVNAATGEVVQRMDYDSFGAVVSDTNPGFQPFGFAGGLLDRDTGLVHFGARDYDPSTARFVRLDPVLAPGQTNGYAYARNDPLNRFDPAGTFDIFSWGAGSAGLPHIPGVPTPEGEWVQIEGYSSEGGAYTADVLAAGPEIGVGKAAYVSALGGKEWVRDATGTHLEDIVLVEGGFGLACAGSYRIYDIRTGKPIGDVGVYVGIRLGPLSSGVGGSGSATKFVSDAFQAWGDFVEWIQNPTPPFDMCPMCP